MWLLRGDKFCIWLKPNGDIKIFWGSGIRERVLQAQSLPC
jgi:hypothetical protein